MELLIGNQIIYTKNFGCCLVECFQHNSTTFFVAGKISILVKCVKDFALIW